MFSTLLRSVANRKRCEPVLGRSRCQAWHKSCDPFPQLTGFSGSALLTESKQSARWSGRRFSEHLRTSPPKKEEDDGRHDEQHEAIGSRNPGRFSHRKSEGRGLFGRP